jgi:hypothetical protein
MVIPVARMLRERGWKVTLLALTTAVTKAEQAGVPYIGMRDLLEYASEDAIERGRALIDQLELGGEVSPEETLAYHAIGIADLSAEHGEKEALRLFSERGRQAFLPTRFMLRVLQGLQPDVVIATNSPRAEQAAILAARAAGIRAVCLVDMFALQEVEWIGRSGYADRVCVLNEAVRRMFVERGRSSEEIVVTGNPAFDSLADPATAERGRTLRTRRGWDDGRTNILWASTVEPARHPFTGETGDPSLPRRVEATLRRLVADDDRLRLIVRYHPSEQIDFVPNERVDFSPSAEPLSEVLHAVDLVVVTASTVGLEAWLAGKPVISLDLSVITADAPYSRMGISVGANDLEELDKLLHEAVGKSLRFPLSGQQHPMAQPGSAARAIVATIENLVLPPAE